MGLLSKRKSKLAFTTSSSVKERGRYRQIVIEAGQFGCKIRLSGLRTSFPISYEAIYHRAARIAAELAIADRKAIQKLKRRTS